jgi:hypothetical protein
MRVVTIEFQPPGILCRVTVEEQYLKPVATQYAVEVKGGVVELLIRAKTLTRPPPGCIPKQATVFKVFSQVSDTHRHPVAMEAKIIPVTDRILTHLRKVTADDQCA